jgi:tRNA1(Val) A37 N6-methylase TrmN6
MQLTDQALGAVMMALQKSLMEQTDIVPVLKNFKFENSQEGLVVMNPPLVKFNDEFEERFKEEAGSTTLDASD